MKKALVVVDMQKDFITGCLGNEECRAVVDQVVDVINSREYRHVFITKDTHHDNYMETQEGKKLPVEHCIVGTDGWKLDERVDEAIKKQFEAKNTTVVQKGSFGSIALGDMLREYRMRAGEDVEFYFVGVCTGICVISNVLIAKAALPESKICVIEKACACVTPESHKTAIEAMKTCQVDVI